MSILLFRFLTRQSYRLHGAYVCIDKVALSCGELYTVLINKAAHGGKGSIIGIIKGTDVCTVTSVLLKLSRRRRY